MCGITGITDKNLAKKEFIEKMTTVIAHRGPDDDGFLVDEHVALGMRRLSIIDLVHGEQPIATPDGRYKIFFNGEIYNYKELKKELNNYQYKTESDTEVILAGFVKWGPEVLKKLRGMFAFCIYDTQEKKIFLARDFFGIKPLYYWTQARPMGPIGLACVAFSSEIKSFFELPGFKPEVNDAAVYNYLSYQYNPLEETFFKNVFKLPPAHYLTIDLKTGKWEKKRYWQFKFSPEEALDEENTRKEILNTMEDSVAHHMIADVPVGSFLSGGIDSSIIATLMQKVRGEKKIKTFTVGFNSVSEGREAKETSEPLGTDHTEISVGAEEYFATLPKAVWHFDEPVADPSAIGLYFLAREARKHVKVVLSGEGADELFGGYNIYLAPIAAERLRKFPKFILKLISVLPFRGRNYAQRALLKLEDWYIGNALVFKPEEIRSLWRDNPMSRGILDTLYREAAGLSDSTKMQYIDINTWLVGDILAKADKMTMAHSLELRVPFLDSSVATLASKLPNKFKWHNGVTKYLLREAFKNVLPESTRKRKKLGFPTPVREWITKERTNVILENPYIKSHFDVAKIEELISDHISKRTDNSRKIYLLLMLALWYNVFIENSKLKIEN
ncbi:MAG: asparagine synthase (glutamine-hydrolyzing) [Candidatus Zambryskibacteria bacterium RIFCSPHIGHO2_12_FULL_48_10]|uniref:asparagine synthase (glutamine-hydrolyzing) n=1 Tax=Candidatus Zambryskibacteria bacterium RIFCSPHIGHO2_01_FULL_46_25 TaxID=1802738 RepID=A0A1G2SZT5_9BACT|nr:MAG: Asparagine synthetase [Parcubacteria group bacterium GW2011_GWA1_47_10]OHA90258.1 MAG: asparagine synthase (glutamine-hydrolyzing) [Candidatus Zambryskibacteria bacterium RIFCSPHIGHO2_01_FULL_46_25]OHB02587.1 MAG: asparagine synthase (glutamine-hydrolyzing) [Candidatus Zambryskibacteria bacterium RIFCSPHIGHO2_12_FULL_48_10]OHB06796.1 MAG: asparagine synthase (glutamine-hydrolyzing) [Candidatus Zambryskibacteria bacterium RIFCSPLOWO2_01_FULL_48_25]